MPNRRSGRRDPERAHPPREVPGTASYDVDGYCVRRRLILPQVVGAAARAVDAIERIYPTMSTELCENIVSVAELPDGRFDPRQLPLRKDVPFIIGDPPSFSPEFLPILTARSLWSLAAALLNTDSPVYHFSNVTIKPPHFGPRMSWHRDFPNRYICPQTSRFLRALIALDDTDQENGCPEVVAGSHLISDDEVRAGRGATAPADGAVVAVDCRRGDVIFLHPKCLHGGGPNRSIRTRRVMVVQFGPADAPLVTSNVETYTGWTWQQLRHAGRA